jgi:hypothetical protein
MNQKELTLINKKEYLKLFNKINRPLTTFFSKGNARIEYGTNGVGYGSRIACFEGFSRLMWGLGPALGNGEVEDLVHPIIQGIINGTNSNHEEYWGVLHDRDQRMVEMPAVALALLYDNQLIWKKLTDFEKKNVYNWLIQITEHECADGNWQFFKVIVGLVLRALGYEVSDETIDVPLAKIDKCYLADGWYQDSSRGRQDYYTPFAFHYYGLIYSTIVPEDKHSEEFRTRAKEFAQQYIHFFAETGANIPFGRSLIYRYAVVSFWSALVYADVRAFPLGVMKGLINRNIRWWMKKPIFDNNGIFSLGYTYPQLMLTEPYNSPLSPYWSNKVFLLLALPEDHDYWTVEESEYPQVDAVNLLKMANMLAVHDNGHAQLLNAGQPGANYHTLTNEKYLKFAYSSCFGFSIPRTNQLKEEAAMDSMLGVQTPDHTILTSRGGQIFEETGQFLVRNKVTDVKVTEGFVASTWRASDRISARTWLTSISGWQIRIHKVVLKEPAVLYETGFAVENNPDIPGKSNVQDHYNYYMGPKGFTGIVDLSSDANNGRAALVNCMPNTNLMTPEMTTLPGLEVTLAEGTHWLVTGVYAHSDAQYAKQKWEQKPVVQYEGDILKVILANEEFVLSMR